MQLRQQQAFEVGRERKKRRYTPHSKALRAECSAFAAYLSRAYSVGKAMGAAVRSLSVAIWSFRAAIM